MSRIAYRTDDVPKWGTGAFTPIPAITPSASSAGEQRRYLQQWAPAPDPMLAGYAATNPNDIEYQPSYATKVEGLPGAFRPVVNLVHAMSYWTTPENMGPNGPNTHMKLWSDNPLPVPARNPGRVAMPAMKQPPWATTIATAWPRPFINWATWGTSRQS